MVTANQRWLGIFSSEVPDFYCYHVFYNYHVFKLLSFWLTTPNFAAAVRFNSFFTKFFDILFLARPRNSIKDSFGKSPV